MTFYHKWYIRTKDKSHLRSVTRIFLLLPFPSFYPNLPCSNMPSLFPDSHNTSSLSFKSRFSKPPSPSPHQSEMKKFGVKNWRDVICRVSCRPNVLRAKVLLQLYSSNVFHYTTNSASSLSVPTKTVLSHDRRTDVRPSTAARARFVASVAVP